MVVGISPFNICHVEYFRQKEIGMNAQRKEKKQTCTCRVCWHFITVKQSGMGIFILLIRRVPKTAHLETERIGAFFREVVVRAG